MNRKVLASIFILLAVVGVILAAHALTAAGDASASRKGTAQAPVARTAKSRSSGATAAPDIYATVMAMPLVDPNDILAPATAAPGSASGSESVSLAPRFLVGTPTPGAAAGTAAGRAVSAAGAAGLAAVPAFNSLSLDAILVMPEAVRANVRAIGAQGRALGRNRAAFSKVGDSTMIHPPFLAAFDNGAYRLGPYAGLQAAIDYYRGSFARSSAAVHKGMHTWTQFDAAWTDDTACRPGEGPLPCEIRLHNPSIAIIRLGVNDAYEPQRFYEEMCRIVDFCLARGVVPVLGTKPDRVDSDNAINGRVHSIAAEYNIPLWDYDLVAGTVPGRGLDVDGMHMLASSARDFAAPATLAAADALEDLSALMMLDALRREIGE